MSELKGTHSEWQGYFSADGPETGDFHMQRTKSDPHLPPCTKTNSTWVKDLYIRAKTVRLLENNIGTNLCDPGLGSDILDMTPKVQASERKKKLVGRYQN